MAPAIAEGVDPRGQAAAQVLNPEKDTGVGLLPRRLLTSAGGYRDHPAGAEAGTGEPASTGAEVEVAAAIARVGVPPAVVVAAGPPVVARAAIAIVAVPDLEPPRRRGRGQIADDPTTKIDVVPHHLAQSPV